ncbi:MAG TPA: DUF4388 domain-containing protein [Holophaga sp.]|nr:DUF4388 domain-containing protein [Holophaga sp.]
MSTLRGNLQSLSLTDVLQLLHINRKTGKLHVIHGKHTGTLFVMNGEVIHAETPQTSGESAAFEVLEWDKGEFEFMPSQIKAPTTIHRTVQDLLMESAHTADSRKRLRTIFPNLHAVPWPRVAGEKLTQGLKLFPEDLRVIPCLDGFRDFIEVMAASEQSEVGTLQTCLLLKEAGRLQVLEPAVTLSVVPLKGSFFRKADHVELSRTVASVWSYMGPYKWDPVRNVKIIGPESMAIQAVKFVDDMEDQTVGIPKELMQSWGLPEGIFVSIRPAPNTP